MPSLDQTETSLAPNAVATRLARYLGAELTAAVVAERPRDQDLGLAATLLTDMRAALATYLPRRLVAHQLAATDAAPWLEWVAGALLYADVSGSTALAEHLTALGREGTEVVTATLTSYFGPMIRLIEQAGGDLLTFGGDALLVLFAGADPARAATTTALALLRELADFGCEVPGLSRFPLTMHIGVEAGPVALVSAGHPQALRYSAMGYAVHAVARAESYGGKGELVLGPRAWAALAAELNGSSVVAAPDFRRVWALRGTAPPPPPLTHASPLQINSLPTLDLLAQQLDRLSPYLPADLLARIVADPNQPRVEADLRPVTVLFAQIVGLDPVLEAHPPAEAAATIDALFRPLYAAVAQFGGFVNKLDLAEEGEKLMAVFGAPVAHEDHAERAARAALLMLAALQAPHGNLHLRIGLNSGNVFAGNVGTVARKEYTVMGDAVNVAARIMTAAAWGEIRCATATAQLVSHALTCDDRRSVVVKGKREPLELLRLTGEREGEATTSAPTAPLIGRADELAWLRDQLNGSATGHGRAVRVMGEAGLGKSRLATALLAEANAAGARVVAVRCLAYNRATPYVPWGAVLRDLCGIGASDDQPARARKLAAALTAAGESAADWLALLADLAQFDAEPNLIVRALDPSQRQTRRFELMLALLRAATWHGPAPVDPNHEQQRTLVLLCDNLHWADQVSLDLWQYVAGHCGSDPLLLLGLHRGPLAWGSGPQGDEAARLQLEPLTPEASARLVSVLAGPTVLSAELQARLVTRAAGNPLFLEELLRAVQQAPAALDALPDSLSGLLLARIDQLDEPSRALLRVAAVVGQRFPVRIVQAIQGSDCATLVRRLVRLDAAELTVTEREHPERVHLFRHAMLQEVAYQSLLYARRRALHRQIAEYLETQHADELTQTKTQYATALAQNGRNGTRPSRATHTGGSTTYLLAHHYRLSDCPERAVPYLLLAGHSARDDYANDQALQHYRWALETLGDQPTDPRVWEAREALGAVLCMLGRYEEAQAEYALLLQTDRAVLPVAVVAEVLRSWGNALEKQSCYSEALSKLREAEALGLAHLAALPPLLLAAIYADIGQVLRRLGAFDQALASCQTGLAQIRSDQRSTEDERIEADLQQLMGTLYAIRGDYATARLHFTKALTVQTTIDDLYGAARSHNNLGYLAQFQSDYAQAVYHYGEAEALARKISAKYVLSSVVLNAAYGYYQLDRYAEATTACRAALALCEEMGDRDGIAKAYDALGGIAYNQGDYSEAQRCHELALALHREQEATYEAGNTLVLLALAQTAQGQPDEARGLAEQALVIAQAGQVPQLEAEALNALAEAALVAATHAERPAQPALLDQAAAAAHAAEACAARIGSKLDQGIALRLQGEIAAQRGAPFAAPFAAALALLSAISSTFEVARTEARLGAALAAVNEPTAQVYQSRAEATLRKIGASGELRRMGH